MTIKVFFRDGFIKDLKKAEITSYGVCGFAHKGQSGEMEFVRVPWEAIKMVTEDSSSSSFPI